ncbi:TPA: DUF826 domain-containing protein [Escherichia coli]|uniref:Protein of uncharacterized function (DUF826) n=1 Tax=Escherichia coli TaxID=562 RepID=A0A2X1NPL5_ECOLX|nr:MULTISPECIES: DUF826 domain-containing protein [Enterobacteriaceae]EEC8117397.1 DUF826 domain-containing protein [Escherichia coli]EER4876752.1 DUF826 domain-containing protein [Escherichia coli]EEU1785525.1 DUF826 domain-containing protein [Escherichia coli]EEV2551941.1 DUF826 domain-containing protein [Escherichia coli]EEW8593642.1 DUF826 domain-containing protein [Escherichia coli]
MPEIKGTVTEELVKQALYSEEVNRVLKAQVRKDFEAQIDAYVDEVLARMVGRSPAENSTENAPQPVEQPEPVQPGTDGTMM